ncbi:MAG: FAD binding domain-containing protein [Terriglobia bacterium]
MSMPAFSVLRPRRLEEALEQLSARGAEAMLVAGGTDVVPNLRMKLFAPRSLIDLKGLRELVGIAFDSERGLRIGALTTIAAIAESAMVRQHYPVLALAAGSIASPPLRNMGTLGGNLCLETRCLWYNQSYSWRKACGFCLKKDGDVCHVAPGGKFCWAVWSGDTAAALFTLDAEIEIAGPRGRRRLPLAGFYKHDGMDRIDLGRGEILTAVHVPAQMAGYCGRYDKLRIRSAIDYPLAGVAVVIKFANGTCQDARIALTGMNPAPVRVEEAGRLLARQPYSAELAAAVAHAVIRTAKPLTTSVSTPEYRRDALRAFVRRALRILCEGNGSQP